MSVKTIEQVDVLRETYFFTGFETCDRPRGYKGHMGVVVSEQAYHRWTKDGKELFFCNHHNARHEMALVADGWTVESSPQATNLGQPMDINHIHDTVDA